MRKTGRSLMPCKAICFLTIFIIARQVESYSWHSTIAEFLQLTKTERVLIQDLKATSTQAESTINLLLSQIKTLTAESRRYLPPSQTDRSSDSVTYSARFAQQLSNIQETSSALNLMSNYTSVHAVIASFPNITDMRAVIEVLIELQQTNFLRTKNLANGRIMDIVFGGQLSARACYEVATTACASFYEYSHEQCAEWCGEASIRMHGDPTAKYNQDDLDKLLYTSAYVMQKYLKLCSASINQSYIGNAFSSHLKCFLWASYGHPMLLLQPIRAELLSVHPTVVIFYNVISNQDVAYLRNITAHNLSVALTMAGNETVRLENDRITHNSWLTDSNHSIVRKLSSFAQILTNLPVLDCGEGIQIANYGVGGRYKPHADATIAKHDPTQHVPRRATLMYYLSDVQYGGATAFPALDMAVKPEKGAAVFWHNLFSDTGLVNYKTLHGACPIVLGDKWVANKWIEDCDDTSPRKHEYYV